MTDAIDKNAFRDFERDAHHRLADTYHACFVPVSEHGAEPLLDAANVAAGMRVLDVACGSGAFRIRRRRPRSARASCAAAAGAHQGSVRPARERASRRRRTRAADGVQGLRRAQGGRLA
jgi:hypothetical protein